MITYRHFGDAGDIVAGLPVIRHLGRGILFLEASPFTRVQLTKENWRGLDRILREQPYIAEVMEWKREIVSYNLNDWRAKHFRSVIKMGQDREKSLLTWQLEQYQIPPSAAVEPWIKIEPKKIARVVFNRTGAGRPPQHVYQNPEFPWHWVWKKYKDQAVFVGTGLEHEAFCATCGDLPHVQTKDLYEAAQVIAGCDMFVGNQSVCFWLAEAMKKKTLLEVWRGGPNCLVFRDGSTHGWNRDVILPEL